MFAAISPRLHVHLLTARACRPMPPAVINVAIDALPPAHSTALCPVPSRVPENGGPAHPSHGRPPLRPLEAECVTPSPRRAGGPRANSTAELQGARTADPDLSRAPAAHLPPSTTSHRDERDGLSASAGAARFQRRDRNRGRRHRRASTRQATSTTDLSAGRRPLQAGRWALLRRLIPPPRAPGGRVSSSSLRVVGSMGSTSVHAACALSGGALDSWQLGTG
ncbi:hypothetical protein DMC30DRAFT_27206 [Rhodotorula diobovata]|uniref:Uncharacterized protein n=1 Tax=Rhodotorula diobovata TaxID=5288 RepID=A0A5C5FSK6_9BASI|nr:hypothetical protein DMC30DRAFT_27206 [Rhodotorula diobovata]